MANFKRKSTHRKNKGCGLCDIEKRAKSRIRMKPKYKLDRRELSVMT